MKLLVVSHTPHILSEDKKFFGWGPTVQELNYISLNFSKVYHIAPCIVNNEVPASHTEVHSSIQVIPTVNRGGTTLFSKLRVAFDSFEYARLILRYLRQCEMVHVRCPANISLVALLILILFPTKKKWIKYAGDWYRKNDFSSYQMQRHIIRRFIKNAIATINSFPVNEPSFVYHFYNPSFFKNELCEARTATVKKTLPSTGWIALFVGTLTLNKGPHIVVRAFADLLKKYNGKLYLIGDGEMKQELEEQIKREGIDKYISLEGWKSRQQLKVYYTIANFVVLPSLGEGWPKVISEGMSFGVIPIVSDVSSMGKIFSQFGIGKVIKSYDAALYEKAVLEYIEHPARWKVESEIALDAADLFSFETWWEKLRALFAQHFMIGGV